MAAYMLSEVDAVMRGYDAVRCSLEYQPRSGARADVISYGPDVGTAQYIAKVYDTVKDCKKELEAYRRLEMLQFAGVCRHYISATRLPDIAGAAGLVLHPVSKRLEPDPMCMNEKERKHEGLAASFQTYFALFAARQFGGLEHTDASSNNIVACKEPGVTYTHTYSVVVRDWNLLPLRLRGEQGIKSDCIVLAKLKFQSDRYIRIIDWGKWNRVDPTESTFAFNDTGRLFCGRLPASGFWSWPSLNNTIGGLITTMRNMTANEKFMGHADFYTDQLNFPLGCPGIAIRHRVETIDTAATATKKRSRECDLDIDEGIEYSAPKRRDPSMYKSFGKMKSRSCGL